MKFEEVRVIKSGRRTMELRVDDFGRVTLRVPERAKEGDIRRFFESRREWAERHAEKLKHGDNVGFTDGEIRAMEKKARSMLPVRVAYYAMKTGVTYGRITVRRQVTKWGSCTSRGDLNFNCMLALMPDGVIDSVIVHELCHIKHMDHSKAFYNEVRRVLPDYDAMRKWLSENGSIYMRKMRIYREEKRKNA